VGGLIEIALLFGDFIPWQSHLPVLKDDALDYFDAVEVIPKNLSHKKHSTKRWNAVE